MGNTPLHVAAQTDNPLCIKLLLNHNATSSLSELLYGYFVAMAIVVHTDVCLLHSIENKEGKTALDIAEERKFDDCVELVCPLIGPFTS